MPTLKKNIAALHDIFIHFFHCCELLQISSCEVSGKDSGVCFVFFSRAIEKSRAFVSALLAGINLNLLNHQGPMLETAFSRAHAGGSHGGQL